MSLFRFNPREHSQLTRRLSGVVLILACLGLMVLLIQPAAARSQAQGAALNMQLVINEVAWGGTPANATHEWIELHNPGSAPVDLTNWHLDLKTTSGGPVVASIPLAPNNLPGNTNTLPAGGYFLMERGSASISGVPADLVYDNAIALADGGMVLELFDGAGIKQDTANANGGPWPAGSNSGNVCSMERVPGQQDTDNAWRSNDNLTKNGTDGSFSICGTPGRLNSTLPFTATPPPPDTTKVYPVRAVVINEVAWAGTLGNRYGQWIELYNPGVADIDLNGWVLRSTTSGFYVPLSGIIKANSYFLLERRDLITPVAVFKNLTPDLIYYNAPLSTTGESLQLISPNPNNPVIDTANQGGGSWPAGNYATACSMERGGANLPDVRTAWLTNINQNTVPIQAFNGDLICGTPRNQNWAYSVTPTPIPTSTPTRTPYPPYRTPTASVTPKHSATPTRNPYAPTPASVFLNEFLPQPRSDWNGDGKVNSGDQFIEIINVGANAVSLNGWSLDDQPGDSNPYYISNVTIQPKARLVFFGSQTGILLSSGGDTVRLFTPGLRIVDAFTYGVVRNPDQSWCRLPDGGQTWVFGCAPSITTANHLAPSVIVGNRVEAAICLSKKLPPGVQAAECDTTGLAAWDERLWDDQLPYPLYLDAGQDVYILD